MRFLELGAFKGNIAGPSRSCDLWIDGRLHLTGIRTLRAATDEFKLYVAVQQRKSVSSVKSN